jgi:hypothetical protein
MPSRLALQAGLSLLLCFVFFFFEKSVYLASFCFRVATVVFSSVTSHSSTQLFFIWGFFLLLAFVLFLLCLPRPLPPALLDFG